MMTRIFPFIAVLLAIGLFFGYINPTRTGSIADKQAQIESYENALAAAERFKEKENELIRARASIPSEDLARLESFLPDGVDNVQIILDLNSLAANSGMTLSDFETSNDSSTSDAENTTIAAADAGDGTLGLTADEPIESLDLTISATGTYNSFRSFLDGVEQSLRMLDVVSVAVTDSETGVYTYEMTIRLYWLR